MWENNIKDVLNKQCKAIAFYITLICKLAAAFLGHYSEGEKLHWANYFKQPSLQVQGIGLFFRFFFFTLRAILHLPVFNGPPRPLRGDADVLFSQETWGLESEIGTNESLQEISLQAALCCDTLS